MDYPLIQNPKVMPKLLGLYDASEPKMDCIQKNYLLPTPVIYGEEDCLYLNVYRFPWTKGAADHLEKHPRSDLTLTSSWANWNGKHQN